MNHSQWIHAGWLIDGSGSPAQPHMLVHIRDGVIQEIKPLNSRIPEPITSDITDWSGCTVLPGLIDSHLHLFMSGTGDREVRNRQVDAPFSDTKDVIFAHICQLLKYGVAAVRDGGDKHGHALRYKIECLDFYQTPICIKAAGRAWHQPGRYGTLIGRPPSGSLSESIAGETDRIDQVKIVNSGLNSLRVFGKETAPQFTLDELTEGVKAAACRGWKTMVHANGMVPVRIAIEAGCHSIEHGFFMGKDNLKRMADQQVVWVPTAVTMKAYAKWLKPGSTESAIAERNFEHQMEQIAFAKSIGVPIALGTDAGSLGVFHGAAIIEELEILMNAGYRIEEAIQCATETGANLLGLNRAGRIAPGMSAILVAAPGSHRELPQSLSRIQYVSINPVSVG